MVREFKYRGNSLEELQAMSSDALLSILPARQRRSLTRGNSEEKRKLIDEIKNSIHPFSLGFPEADTIRVASLDRRLQCLG